MTKSTASTTHANRADSGIVDAARLSLMRNSRDREHGLQTIVSMDFAAS